MHTRRLALLLVLAMTGSGCAEPGLLLAHTTMELRDRMRPMEEKDWEPVDKDRVNPWHQGAPLVEERYIYSRNYTVPSRYTANGTVTRHTDASLERLGESLLARYPEARRQRVLDDSASMEPIAFIDRRVFLVSADPPVLALVPARFEQREAQDAGTPMTRRGQVSRAYDPLRGRDRAARISTKLVRLTHWANDLELSPVLPHSAGIEIVSPLWRQPVPLDTALADPRFGFQQLESTRFPGYLELRPHASAQRR